MRSRNNSDEEEKDNGKEREKELERGVGEETKEEKMTSISKVSDLTRSL